VLAICRANLAPQGIAFVSYNTYPGWHMRDMVRNMMLYHSAGTAGAQAKVQQSRALLGFLAQNVPADAPYSHVLKQEIELLGKEQDAYLFHDHLEENNHPVYFHEFAAHAKRHGLAYLAEADFSSMLLSNLPKGAAEGLKPVAGDLVRLEQYMDFIRSRMFRQTLLVHEGVPIRRKLEAQAIREFYVCTPARPADGQVQMTPGVAVTFRAPQGSTLTTVNPLTKAAMLLLGERWPLGYPYPELAASARVRLQHATGMLTDAGTDAREEAQLANELMKSYGVGAIELRVSAPDLCLKPSTFPVASPLARWQVEHGRPLVNLRHEPVQLDEASRQVLRLLDGTRDRDALVEAMVGMTKEGKLHVEHEGRVLTEGKMLEAMLWAGLQESVNGFGRAALLVK
jgi:methyltransferase-like protein